MISVHTAPSFFTYIQDHGVGEPDPKVASRLLTISSAPPHHSSANRSDQQVDSLRIPSLGLTLYHFLRQQVDSLVDSLRISSLDLRISRGFSTDFVLGSTDFCASKWILYHFDALAVLFRFIYTDALIKRKKNRKTREKREGEGGRGRELLSK